MNKYEFLSCISLIYLQRLEFTLSPFERIVFFRLFLTFGYKKFLKKDIKKIALKIDIHYLKLEKAINVLLKNFILIADDYDQIGINREYLKQLNGQRKIKNRIKNIQKHPKLDFLLQLFKKLFQIKISHKQKKRQQLLNMDYKQWLVLTNLISLSDRNGIVLGAGTHELTSFTGLSRFSLLRCVTYLFKQGILRSKIDGTLNNVYLNFVSSIYFINLSHPIWGERRIFGRYLVFNYPQQTFILKQLLESLDGWNPDEPLGDLEIIEFILKGNEQSNSIGDTYLLKNHEISIQHILQVGQQWNTMFHREFLLSSGYAASQKKLSLNSNELNFKRLNYIFCYLASHYPNITSIVDEPLGHLLPDTVKGLILKLFRKVEITEQMEKKIIHNRVRQSEVMAAQNHLKQEIISLLVQYAYRSEMSHIISALHEVIDREYYFRAVPIGCSDELPSHKIYFSPDPYLKLDELFFIQYTEIRSTDSQISIPAEAKIIKAYRRSIKQMDFDLKTQLELGLLGQQCLGLDQFD